VNGRNACICTLLVTQAILNTPGEKRPAQVEEGSDVDNQLQLAEVEAAAVNTTSVVEKALKRRLPTTPRTPEKRPRLENEQNENGNRVKRAAKCLFRDVSDSHPLNFMRKEDWSPAKKRRIRKGMFNRKDQGDWIFNDFSANTHFNERGNFRLGNLFREVSY
jgi:hypothetical protein